MINYPITFHRDFQNDFPPFLRRKGGSELYTKCKRVALATLPLMSTCKSLRGPISMAMSSLRAFTHANQLIENLTREEVKKASIHLVHTIFATASVGFYLFNPVYTSLLSSSSDLITHSQNFIESFYSKYTKGVLENFSFMALDILFLHSICSGSIEVTVACMLVQIALDLHLSVGRFKKGEYFEAFCQSLLAGIHVHQAIPQFRVLDWTWKYGSAFNFELKKDENGFVYLDVPDDYLKDLHTLLGDKNSELPPYFKKGRAGAHVSVISKSEMRNRGNLTIDEIGKKFTFRVVNVDSVVPEGWQGVNKVQYLTLSCPELETFRAKYGFSEKLEDHDYHFTFSVDRG